MPERVVCPACYDGACSECTGPGCYCNCQDPDMELDEGCQFGHDEIDECDECGGCHECGNCFCDEDEDYDDE